MKNHIDGIQMLDDVVVTAFADVIEENAKALAEGFENAYVTTDYTTMAPYVDAVLLALPHDLHYECGMFFARNGKHILMEKPPPEAENVLSKQTQYEIERFAQCIFTGKTPVTDWAPANSRKQRQSGREAFSPFCKENHPLTFAISQFFTHNFQSLLTRTLISCTIL